MLTKRQNLIECVSGGNPDRYVNQYEAFNLIVPMIHYDLSHFESDGYMIDDWGVYQAQVKGQENMGVFPLHDMEHRVIKDICNWRNEVIKPKDPDCAEIWEPLQAQAEATDKNEQFVTSVCIPGMLERCHHLMEMTECMAAFYEEPEKMEELIDMIVEYELEVAKCHIKYIKPEVLLHHDDWGTKLSTFMAPDMLEEFFLKPYQRVYGYYKDHGVKYIVHHSDSYGETLLPFMEKVGIDIWQGCLRTTNDLPRLVEEWGGKITFMGGIENAMVDKPGWTEEEVIAEVNTALDFVHSKKYYIPCMTSGLNSSSFPGVYDIASRTIDERSAVDFK